MLKNNSILITGANGGIGSSISEILLKNEANLILFYNKNRNKIDELISDNKNFESQIEVFQVNLENSLQLENTLNNILNSREINSFIHCPTLPIQHKSVSKFTWNDYQSHIVLQTKSFLQIVQSLLPGMKQNKGKIIGLLTSYTVGTPPTNMSNYIVGKYSLLGLVKSLAVELGPFGITVNCVSPSMAETPLTANLPSKLKEITEQQTPLKRLVTPNDIANTVLFLCSKMSDYVNGENILVAGGQTMH